MKQILVLFALFLSISLQGQEIFKTVDVSAGNLSVTLTEEELSTITNLTLRGTMDARDFKVMRTKMKSLSVLDIKEISIIEYIGKDGTYFFEVTPAVRKYDADEIPSHSFLSSPLTKIELPQTLKSIAAEAFYFCRVKEVVFSSSIESIKQLAFRNCENIESLEIQGEFVSIGYSAFYACERLQLLSIDASKEIKFDDSDGFYSPIGSALKAISIRAPVVTIGKNAFRGCSGLTHIEFSSSMRSLTIGEYGFASIGISDLIIPSTVVNFKTDEFAFSDCYFLKSVVFPPSIVDIGTASFYNCKSLADVVLPNSLKEIGTSAFFGCQSLSINIPSTVEYIYGGAFSGCDNVNVEDGNINYLSIDGVLFDKEKTKIMHYPVSKIGHYDIPNSVDTICESAFYKSILESINIPISIKYIGDSAFGKCAWLKSIIIPSSMKALDQFYIFSGCVSLESLVIPSSIETFGSNTNIFNGCSSLKNIYLYNQEPLLLTRDNDALFGGVNKNTCILHVPKGSKVKYELAYGWNEFKKILEMEGGTGISENIFSQFGTIPNPIFDGFQLENITEKIKISIFNLKGQLVFDQIIEGEANVSLSTLSKGIYILKVNISDAVFQRKIIKE